MPQPCHLWSKAQFDLDKCAFPSRVSPWPGNQKQPHRLSGTSCVESSRLLASIGSSLEWELRGGRTYNCGSLPGTSSFHLQHFLNSQLCCSSGVLLPQAQGQSTRRLPQTHAHTPAQISLESRKASLKTWIRTGEMAQ